MNNQELLSQIKQAQFAAMQAHDAAKVALEDLTRIRIQIEAKQPKQRPLADICTILAEYYQND